jgi:hypothetical protein
MIGGMERRGRRRKQLHDESYLEGREEKGKDISSYWMALRKKEDNRI